MSREDCIDNLRGFLDEIESLMNDIQPPCNPGQLRARLKDIKERMRREAKKARQMAKSDEYVAAYYEPVAFESLTHMPRANTNPQTWFNNLYESADDLRWGVDNG
jgi:hypothetical protein